MKDIFKSPRFWLIVVIAVLQSLAVFNVLNSEQVDQLINIISIALGSMVVVRTIDRTADVKSTSTTISMPSNVSNVTASTDASHVSDGSINSTPY